MSMTIKLDLPDALATEAREAGLLAPGRLADWVADEVRRKRARDQFGQMLKKLQSVADEPMSIQKVQAEVDAVRAVVDTNLRVCRYSDHQRGSGLEAFGIGVIAASRWQGRLDTSQPAQRRAAPRGQSAAGGVFWVMGSSPQELAGAAERARGVKGYSGRVVYMYAYDVAYEMKREPVTQLLGQPMAQFSVDASKRSPRHLFFFRPQMVRLPAMERIGPRGRVRVERTVKLLPVGALSVTVAVPFSVSSIEDLVVYHDLEFSNGSLQQEVRQLVEEARRELARYFIRPAAQLAEEEAYTVFCIDSPLAARDGRPLSAEDWLGEHRREVAALLTQEADIGQLSRQEAAESTDRCLSYYQDDLTVVDWDAALLVQEPRQLDEVLYVLELANLQLAELEAYDRLLDTALEHSYRDLTRPGRRARGEVMQELREIRVDLARFSDELSNITKFFGDWHLARIYQTISARFHLGDWHRTIDEKLKTLDDLYQLLNQDRTNRWMLSLEITIVVLFVLDLILLLLGLKRG